MSGLQKTVESVLDWRPVADRVERYVLLMHVCIREGVKYRTQVDICWTVVLQRTLGVSCKEIRDFASYHISPPAPCDFFIPHKHVLAGGMVTGQRDKLAAAEEHILRLNGRNLDPLSTKELQELRGSLKRALDNAERMIGLR